MLGKDRVYLEGYGVVTAAVPASWTWWNAVSFLRNTHLLGWCCDEGRGGSCPSVGLLGTPVLDQNKSQRKVPRGSASPSLEVASNRLSWKVCKKQRKPREIPAEKPSLHTTVRTSCSSAHFDLYNSSMIPVILHFISNWDIPNSNHSESNSL